MLGTVHSVFSMFLCIEQTSSLPFRLSPLAPLSTVLSHGHVPFLYPVGGCERAGVVYPTRSHFSWVHREEDLPVTVRGFWEIPTDPCLLDFMSHVPSPPLLVL